MVGGLIVSQVLTLSFTPVYYIYLDKLRSKRPPAEPEDDVIPLVSEVTA